MSNTYITNNDHVIQLYTSKLLEHFTQHGTMTGLKPVQIFSLKTYSFTYSMYSVRQKKVSPKVDCHFLSNHLEFSREILHIYYLYTYT